ARRSKLVFGLYAEVLGDRVHQFKQREPLTAGDVDHFAAQIVFACASKQIGENSVFHKGEIAGLQAVAEDDGLAAGEIRLGESRDDRSIRRIGELTRTEDVEIPQAHA